MLAVKNVTGEAYIAALQACFDAHQTDILSGTLPLCLQPRALEYIALRIEALEELERLRGSSPVEYLQARVATLQDYKAIDRLRHPLARVKHLVLTSLNAPLRDPTRILLTPFTSLTTLEIQDCDLSTCAWQGLSRVQGGLKTIIITNSTEALAHVLAPHTGNEHAGAMRGEGVGVRRQLQRLGSTSTAVGGGGVVGVPGGVGSGETGGAAPPCWPTLTMLRVSFNSVSDMDASLQLLPKLADLCLSDNCITHIDNLQHCTSLTRLDMSSNRLRCVAGIAAVAPTLRALRLQGNALSSVQGVDSLMALEHLDLRDTLISSFQDIAEVCKLPRLTSLLLSGTPLSRLPTYRLGTLCMLSNPADVLLDGRRPSARELSVLMSRTGMGRIAHACCMTDMLQAEYTLWQAVVSPIHTPKPPPTTSTPSRPPTPPSATTHTQHHPSVSPSPAKQHGAALGTRSSRAFGQVVVVGSGVGGGGGGGGSMGGQAGQASPGIALSASSTHSPRSMLSSHGGDPGYPPPPPSSGTSGHISPWGMLGGTTGGGGSSNGGGSGYAATYAGGGGGGVMHIHMHATQYARATTSRVMLPSQGPSSSRTEDLEKLEGTWELGDLGQRLTSRARRGLMGLHSSDVRMWQRAQQREVAVSLGLRPPLLSSSDDDDGALDGNGSDTSDTASDS